MKKCALIVAVITVIGFLLVAWLPCQADDSVINACVKKKNGQLRIVSDPTKCLKSELPIKWGGAVEPQPSGQNKVYDANDQYLGNFMVVVTPFDAIEVFIPSLKKQARIYAFDGNIGYRYLYFESGDCTGQAYSDNTAFMFHIWQTSGKYYTGAAAIPIQITAHSYKYMDETCYSSNELLDVIAASEITLPFTTPVGLPMRLE